MESGTKLCLQLVIGGVVICTLVCAILFMQHSLTTALRQALGRFRTVVKTNSFISWWWFCTINICSCKDIFALSSIRLNLNSFTIFVNVANSSEGKPVRMYFMLVEV